MKAPIRNIESQRRREIAQFIADNPPATYSGIAEQFDITQSTARDHVQGLVRVDNLPIGSEEVEGEKLFYYGPARGDHVVTPEPDDREMKSKSALTKEAKVNVRELMRFLKKRHRGRTMVTPDDGLQVRDGNQDMVIHSSDDHIGAYYEDEYGDVSYDAEIAVERSRKVSKDVLSEKRRREAAGVEFDTVHLVLGGDHVHGAGIHGDQPWESCLPIPGQLKLTTDIYIEMLDTLSEHFPSVQVVCQRGNHGELRGDGFSPDDNVDDAFFITLEDRVADRGYDNVRFIRSNGANYTIFWMRNDPAEDRNTAEKLGVEVGDLPEELRSGWRGHLRHGQNSLEHVGTSAGKKKWYNWADRHQFDIAYRGHYHQLQTDRLNHRWILMSGAPVPPSDYEESLAEWDEPAGTIHGVSDDDPFEWLEPVSFNAA